jgi:multicomponent Na+:H+ antiporter subunit A
VATLGMVGFGIALMYVFFSAPDLGITQIMVETLTVILLVLVLFRCRLYRPCRAPAARMRDALVAVSLGGLMTLLILAVNAVLRYRADLRSTDGLELCPKPTAAISST